MKASKELGGRRCPDADPRDRLGSAETRTGNVVLRVSDLAPGSAPLELLRGEVLGLAELVGAGRTELLRAIFGLDPVRRGEVRIGTTIETDASPARRLAQGIGLLSEDRKGEGLCLARFAILAPGTFARPVSFVTMARQTVRTGCTHLGLSSWVQELVTGAIIVLAVTVDRVRRVRTTDAT